MRHDDNKTTKSENSTKNFNFFLVIFFMPDSDLNFIIKLRHITTYLESGVITEAERDQSRLNFSNQD